MCRVRAVLLAFKHNLGVEKASYALIHRRVKQWCDENGSNVTWPTAQICL